MRNSMTDLFMILLNFIHDLGITIWLGGAIFFVTILLPGLNTLPKEAMPYVGALNKSITKRWLPLVWSAIVLIILSGLLRAYYFGYLSPDIMFETSTGNHVLSKMILSLIMIILGLAQTNIGLKLSKGATPEYIAKIQKPMKILAYLIIILAVITLALGASL